MFAQQYQIKLWNFEGPFDLLLFLIKRDEINISDIPIAKLAQEFLDYVRVMQMLDLELAGEFIVTAATLMQIKVRMLLPKAETDAEEEDPRAELVRRLLEYKKYKEMAESFGVYEQEQKSVYYRQYFADDVKTAAEEDLHETLLKNVSLFDLVAAFKRALDKAPQAPSIHTVETLPVTIEEQCEFILGELTWRPQFSFSELAAHMAKIRIVVTFLALLELIRTKMVAIRQPELFDDILIYKQ